MSICGRKSIVKPKQPYVWLSEWSQKGASVQPIAWHKYLRAENEFTSECFPSWSESRRSISLRQFGLRSRIFPQGGEERKHSWDNSTLITVESGHRINYLRQFCTVNLRLSRPILDWKKYEAILWCFQKGFVICGIKLRKCFYKQNLDKLALEIKTWL